MSGKGKPSPRVREHIDRLQSAGLDTDKFYEALVAIRDDTALPAAHREALYKLIAMESYVWYVEALRNEPLDRLQVRDALKAHAAEQEQRAATEPVEAAGPVTKK